MRGLISFFWVAGLLIAGSDHSGSFWINLAGLALFSGASFLVVMILDPDRTQKSENRRKAMPLVNSSGKKGATLVKNRRLSARYAA